MEFSDEQKKIIGHTGGHELVIACPGSGKTTTILKKVEYLVGQGTDPRRILVVTFTKAAAKDMAERFNGEYGHIKGVCFSTIHAICFSILRNEYGLTAANILKEWETVKYYKMYLKSFIAAPNLEDAAKDIISRVSAVRNAGLNPTEVFKNTFIIQNTEIPFPSMYQGYERMKKTENKIDFDDMLILCRDMFKQYKEILEKYQTFYDYIIIDEYQDTNKIQAEIFYKLSEKSGNLCVVGDDDQSIYGFRAADSGIMLKFNKKFPDTVKFTLSKNYRCGKNIVRHADSLIRHNKNRFGKKFETGTDFNGEIFMGGYEEEGDEMRNLVEWIERKKNEGVPLKEIAVLYRTNREAINMMPALKTAEIPISMKERPGDIHRHFIFEAIQAYYTLSQMVTDDDDRPLPPEAEFYLGKILNCPARYLKTEYFAKCNLSPESVRECIRKYTAADSKVKYRKEQIKCDLGELLDDLRSMKTMPVKGFLKTLKRMGISRWVRDQAEFRKISAGNAEDILKNLISEGESFKTMEEWMNYTGQFEEYLETAALNEDGVRLSTFHGAKGLEWTCVWMVNLNAENTPHKLSIDEGGEKALEEERRLFYVAMTRAKKELQMSFVKNPSPFLAEMFPSDKKIRIKKSGRQQTVSELPQT